MFMVEALYGEGAYLQVQPIHYLWKNNTEVLIQAEVLWNFQYLKCVVFARVCAWVQFLQSLIKTCENYGDELRFGWGIFDTVLFPKLRLLFKESDKKKHVISKNP